ncbi:hypothetical protein SLNSH_08105 [Alsobacter soli]|uniref:Ornithine cyclodeaminase n=1 Tax=Alsobacter soli TaxID=2109933 RepID=A0A2T1HV78_9HYPH|nr:ornithine cyclodeaminase family protein [Alsobacter soli]PSC05541.1 hypothetical protein SLNSH_08105 [Alsobacter soli]
MTDVLYLSARDIDDLGMEAGAVRRRVVEVFRAIHAGEVVAPAKQVLDIGPGHSFQSLAAAWERAGFAACKWLGVAPVAPGSDAPGVDAVIALNDFETGRLLALMDGNVITGLRTAAMSAAAAHYLAAPDSATLGLIGCGLQARTHLSALREVLPGLRTIRAFSRTRASAESLAQRARADGWGVEVLDDPREVVAHSDVVVTTVPMTAGLEPFLDPRWLRPGAFVSAVDIARSWAPEGLRELDLVVTDSHEQAAKSAPLSTDFGPSGSYHADLSELCGGAKPGRSDGRQRAIFVFRGLGAADLAVAGAAYEAARAAGCARTLSR